MAMSAISRANTGAAFLQSLPSSPGGNWVQSAATAASSADWMDPASSGPDTISLAANAFAATQQVSLTNKNSIAVNKGIAHAQAVLSGKVNVLA